MVLTEVIITWCLFWVVCPTSRRGLGNILLAVVTTFVVIVAGVVGIIALPFMMYYSPILRTIILIFAAVGVFQVVGMCIESTYTVHTAMIGHGMSY